MTTTFARNHVQQIINSFDNYTATSQLQQLLSLRSISAQRVGPTLRLISIRTLVDSIPTSNVSNLIVAHLQALDYTYRNDFAKAFEAQLQVTEILRTMLAQAEDNQLLPALQSVTLDLRLLAVQADLQATDTTDKDAATTATATASSATDSSVSPLGNTLQRAMAELTNCFRTVSTDRNADLSKSKKLGMLALVNHLFCIAFRLNNFAFLKPLVKVVEGEKGLADRFALAHRVTFRYYMGRKAMYDANYR